MLCLPTLKPHQPEKSIEEQPAIAEHLLGSREGGREEGEDIF